jgi:GTPase SAR1 family protein
MIRLLMSDTPQDEHLLKILIIGDSAVGKSCLFLRYTDNKFNKVFEGTLLFITQKINPAFKNSM